MLHLWLGKLVSLFFWQPVLDNDTAIKNDLEIFKENKEHHTEKDLSLDAHEVELPSVLESMHHCDGMCLMIVDDRKPKRFACFYTSGIVIL